MSLEGIHHQPDSANLTTNLFESSNSELMSDNHTTLPEELQFNTGHLITVITYSILIIVSSVGNITVLTVMWRRRRKARTRINTMLMHLAIADLLVCVFKILYYVVEGTNF